MQSLEDAQLNYIETFEDAEACLRWLSVEHEVLCIDTETSGLRWFHPSFKLRLFQIGDYDTAWVMRADRFGFLIERILSQYTGQLTFHNSAFDLHVLKVAGFSLPDPRRIDDTLIMGKLFDPRGRHGLKELGTKHFGKIASLSQDALKDAFDALGLKNDEHGWATIPYDVPAYSIYSGLDTVLGARLWKLFKPEIMRLYSQAYEREMASWQVGQEYEHRGIRVDLTWAQQLHDEMSSELETVYQQLAAIGITNPGSKQQKLDKLTEDGWLPDQFTESGQIKLDKAILEGIDHEAVPLLIEYGRLTKWRKAYVEAVLTKHVGGRVYPSWNQFAAKTGRTSMNNPPIHQIPSHSPEAWKLRKMFLPEEGCDFYSVDFSSQEQVLQAHFSKDQILLDIMRTGADLHKYTASVIYDCPIADVTKEQRSISKTTNYASSYGAGVQKLARTLQLPIPEVRRIRDKLNTAFPDVTRWKEQLEREGQQHFYAGEGAWAETWGGRRVFAEEWEGKPKLYTLNNAVLQGSGVDVLKESFNRIAAAGLSEYLMFSVHDENCLSVPRGEEGYAIAKEVAQLMEITDLEFPLTTDVSEAASYWIKG